jgi:[ribosomal protein S5]-alanine N-acetyltransferase
MTGAICRYLLSPNPEERDVEMSMMPIPPTLLRTLRLELRAARREDALSLFAEYTGRIDAARYLQRDAHVSQGRTEAVIDAWGESNWTTNSRFVWSIIYKSDAKAVGLFLMFVTGNGAEIHYGLGPAFWGQGLATEAGSTVMNWITDCSALSEVSTTCSVQNKASLRVLEKIGLRREQFLPAALLSKSTGETMDAWSYRWKRVD